MRFWRRKNEGFEWHKYVRTTILQRREQRRDQVQKVKVVAVEGIKAAGAAAATGSRDGSMAVSRGLGWVLGAVLRGLAWLSGAVVRGLGWLSGAVVRGARSVSFHARRSTGPALRWVGTMLDPLWVILARPAVAAALTVLGVIVVVAALARIPAYGFTLPGVATFVLGALLLVAGAGSWLARGRSARLPDWLQPWIPLGWGRYVMAAVAAAIVAVGTWTAAAPRGQLASIMPRVPFLSSPPIEGRALVVSAEVIRIGKQQVRLADIEAPRREQRCPLTSKRAWACGQAAEKALSQLIRKKTVKCEVSGTDAEGRPLGICRDGTTEINAQLVKEGHVFAAEGMLARYSSQQSEAQRQKIGLWKGQAERPSTYRAKRWEDAKRKAPDGCPIKGQLASGDKVYVLPWSNGYDSVRIQTGRGDRWFCSESEARDAGWRAAESG